MNTPAQRKLKWTLDYDRVEQIPLEKVLMNLTKRSIQLQIESVREKGAFAGIIKRWGKEFRKGSDSGLLGVNVNHKVVIGFFRGAACVWTVVSIVLIP